MTMLSARNEKLYGRRLLSLADQAVGPLRTIAERSLREMRDNLPPDWPELIRQRHTDKALAMLTLPGILSGVVKADAPQRGAENESKTFEMLLAALMWGVSGDALLNSLIIGPAGATLDSRASSRIAEWARAASVALVSGIVTRSQESLRLFLAAPTDPDVGRRRRPEATILNHVGLTTSQSAALARYEASLPRNWSLGRAERALRRRSDVLLRRRAETIARTEALAAANKSLILRWDELAARGLFDKKVAYLYWITTPDDRLCELCAPMSGLRIPYGNEFRSPSGDSRLVSPVSYPPLHPLCRCTMGLDYE